MGKRAGGRECGAVCGVACWDGFGPARAQPTVCHVLCWVKLATEYRLASLPTEN